jgi:hypothetical protein
VHDNIIGLGDDHLVLVFERRREDLDEAEQASASRSDVIVVLQVP